MCGRVAKTFTIAPFTTLAETASCPSGETAVGGGFALQSNALVIHDTLPTVSLNGWTGVVENTDDVQTHGFDVYAVCCAGPPQVPIELQSFAVE